MAQTYALVSLFEKYVYAVRRTDLDAYHQNFPAGGTNRYIGRWGPAQDSPYDLILWYVSQIIYLS